MLAFHLHQYVIWWKLTRKHNEEDIYSTREVKFLFPWNIALELWFKIDHIKQAFKLNCKGSCSKFWKFKNVPNAHKMGRTRCSRSLDNWLINIGTIINVHESQFSSFLFQNTINIDWQKWYYRAKTSSLYEFTWVANLMFFQHPVPGG